MSEWMPVNIVIGDRTYRIRIEPGQEEVVRKTVKMLNDKILEFRTQFAGKDMQDYISMVMIWFATEQRRGGAERLQDEEAADRLRAIRTLVDEALDTTKGEE